jgi:osmotically-inducible protein OsmY
MKQVQLSRSRDMERINIGAHHCIHVTKLFISVLVSCVLALAAADQKAPAKAAPRTGTGVSAQGDAAIESAIKMKLARSKIGKDKFKVHVQGGVAYWEGTTDIVQHKGAATRMAKTAGAKGVVNKIQISDAARQKAAANLETGRRRAQVKRGEARGEPRSETAKR